MCGTTVKSAPMTRQDLYLMTEREQLPDSSSVTGEDHPAQQEAVTGPVPGCSMGLIDEIQDPQLCPGGGLWCDAGSGIGHAGFSMGLIDKIHDP